MSLRPPPFSAAKVKLRSLALPLLAVAIALFAGTSFVYLNVIWDPGYYGDFGVTLDPDNAGLVYQVAPGSPAAKARIRPGDRIGASTFHGRLLLSPLNGDALPYPGEKVKAFVIRGGLRRSVTLQARPLPALSKTGKVLLAVRCAWLFAFVIMGLFLVLRRPSRMTWAFYLFAVNLVLVPGPPLLPRAPDAWIIAGAVVAHDIIAPAGLAGFLVFCVRFPTNKANGWRRTIQRLAPCTAAIIAANLLQWDLALALFGAWRAVSYGQFITFAAMFVAYLVTTLVLLKQRARAAESERREIAWVCTFLILGMLAALHDVLLRDFYGPWSFLNIFVLGTVVFTITFIRARGLMRHRIKWVALGFVCALSASIVDFMWFGYSAPWFVSIVELLYLALPLTVAYAIIRHRVIDVRFAASRTLTFAIIASVVAFTFAGIDWLLSTRLPSSRFEAAVYAGLALLIGFSLNAGRQRIGKTIDFLFFRQWYRAQEEANTIVDTLSHSGTRLDVYEPLTAGIAQAFSLASTGLFEHIEDGGFVRVADRGWPSGTTWHILPDDPIALRAAHGSRVIDVDALQWQEAYLPAGVAQPTTLFPIVSGKRVAAILLCGVHENGTALASDEIRTIRKACSDAAFVYDTVPSSFTVPLASIERSERVTV